MMQQMLLQMPAFDQRALDAKEKELGELVSQISGIMAATEKLAKRTFSAEELQAPRADTHGVPRPAVAACASRRLSPLRRTPGLISSPEPQQYPKARSASPAAEPLRSSLRARLLAAIEKIAARRGLQRRREYISGRNLSA